MLTFDEMLQAVCVERAVLDERHTPERLFKTASHYRPGGFFGEEVAARSHDGRVYPGAAAYIEAIRRHAAQKDEK